MTHTPDHVVTRASDLIDREGGLGAFMTNIGFGGVFYAITLFLVALVQGIQLVVVGPIKALGRGTIILVEDVFLPGLGAVFGAGTEESVSWFLDGFGSILGPLAQPTSVGVFMSSMFVFAWVAQRTPWSPWVFVTNLSIRGN